MQHTDPFTSFSSFYSSYFPRAGVGLRANANIRGGIARKLRRFLTGRDDPPPQETQSPSLRGATHDWLDDLLANPAACAIWRERLCDRPGAECLEFLLACRCFEASSNGLQRFHLLHSLVHRFIREGAQRDVPLSFRARRRALAEWTHWAETTRLPLSAKFPALTAAVAEVRAAVRKNGAFGLGT